MSSIHTALVRLNVVPQKIGFWEVQLANAIKRAEFLNCFDATQVSKEKLVTRSELSNFERAVRAGTRASILQKRFATLSKPTIDILNSQIAMTKKEHANFADLSLDVLAERNVLHEALKRSKAWLNNKRGAEHSEGTHELVFSLTALYKQITEKEPVLSSGAATLPEDYKTPFEEFLLAALQHADVEAISGNPITLSGARDLFRRTFSRKSYHKRMTR